MQTDNFSHREVRCHSHSVNSAFQNTIFAQCPKIYFGRTYKLKITDRKHNNPSAFCLQRTVKYILI